MRERGAAAAPAPSGQMAFTGHPRTVVKVAQLVPAMSTVFLFCSHDGMIQYSSSFAWHVLCSRVPSLKANYNPKKCARARQKQGTNVFQSRHVIELECPVHVPSL